MKPQRLILLTSIFAISGQFSQAQDSTATTEPVGFVTTTIKASANGSSFATTPISPVLLQASGITGSTIAAITSLASNAITVSNAGWTENQLAASSAYVLFKTGELEGLIARVTSNTADTATLDTLGASLIQLGAVSEDQVQLVQGDSLLSMFGTPADGVVGGTAAQFSANQTDRVNIRDATGITRTFYFNTDVNAWRRSGTSADQGSVPISPLAGAFYLRIGQTAISQVTTGNVPVTGVKYLVPTSGLTYFARFFPTIGTINDFGFQNLPGWSSTDRVNTTDASGVVRSYFWNGTQWRRSGTSADQSSTPVHIGGAVSVSRSGSAGPAQLLSVNIPYNLASQ